MKIVAAALIALFHVASASASDFDSCAAAKQIAVGGYARCLLVAEGRFTVDGRADTRDARLLSCRRKFDRMVARVDARMTCAVAPSNHDLAEATEWASDTLLALFDRGAEEVLYFKAAGAANCSDQEMIRSASECEIAGDAVGHRFSHVVDVDASSYDGAGRPAGCYWDRNGASYFNTNLSSSATWGGTGGICRRTTMQ